LSPLAIQNLAINFLDYSYLLYFCSILSVVHEDIKTEAVIQPIASNSTKMFKNLEIIHWYWSKMEYLYLKKSRELTVLNYWNDPTQSSRSPNQ
jgi:hypothetical protein